MARRDGPCRTARAHSRRPSSAECVSRRGWPPSPRFPPPTNGFGVPRLTAWVPALVGGLFGQKCFNAGPLSLSLPVVDAVEPAAAVVLAVVVFHKSLARSPWELALQLAGAATAVTGIVLLGHCGVVVAEDRRAGLVPGSSGILGL